jgi:hypothetical protein
MPINVVTGSTVGFTVVFFSTATGQSIMTVPSSATLTVTYPLSSNSIATGTATIGMTPSGSFFTANWGSGVAALGITSYSISAPGHASPTTGQLRITT